MSHVRADVWKVSVQLNKVNRFYGDQGLKKQISVCLFTYEHTYKFFVDFANDVRFELL